MKRTEEAGKLGSWKAGRLGSWEAGRLEGFKAEGSKVKAGYLDF